jgi:hypothetical protein
MRLEGVMHRDGRDAGSGRGGPPAARREDYRNFIGLTGQFEALISSYLARRKAAGADTRHESGQVLTVLAFVCGNYLRGLRRLGDRRPFPQVFAGLRDLIISAYVLQSGGKGGKI